VQVLDQAHASPAIDQIAFERFDSMAAAVIEAWRELHAGYNSHESVFSSPAFFAALTRTEPAESLIVATRRCPATGQILGIAPLRMREQLIDPHGIAGRILRRHMRVWGLSGSEPLVSGPGQSDGSIARMLCALGDAPGDFDALELQSVDVDSALWRAVFSAEVQQRFRVYLPNGVRSCHQSPLPDSQDAYLAQFPRKKRYNLSRQIRQIGENLGGPATVVPITGTDQIDLLFSAVATVGNDGGSLLTRSEYEALAAQGLLLNFVVQAGGAPIAVILGIPSGSVYRIHRVLYARSLAPYSPGTSTLHMLNEWMIANSGFRLVDFGFGEPGRTYSSSNRLVERARIYLVRHTLRNRVSFTVHRALVRMESTLRALFDRTQTAREGWTSGRAAAPLHSQA